MTEYVPATRVAPETASTGSVLPAASNADSTVAHRCSSFRYLLSRDLYQRLIVLTRAPVASSTQTAMYGLLTRPPPPVAAKEKFTIICPPVGNAAVPGASASVAVEPD